MGRVLMAARRVCTKPAGAAVTTGLHLPGRSVTHGIHAVATRCQAHVWWGESGSPSWFDVTPVQDKALTA